jgi:hypothetical protein
VPKINNEQCTNPNNRIKKKSGGQSGGINTCTVQHEFMNRRLKEKASQLCTLRGFSFMDVEILGIGSFA